MGNEIIEELTATLDSFLIKNLRDEGGNYEVEAKFGTFIDVAGETRISLPIMTTTILQPGSWYKFKSEISLESHRLMNTLLNERCSPKSSMPLMEWTYKRKRTMDYFYELESGQKTRLSISDDENIIEAIRKERIADLSIYIPSSPYDVRISINVERPLFIPETITRRSEFESHFGGCKPFLTRKKDRLSYCWARRLLFDLTQISQGSSLTKIHEFEVEVINIMREGGEDGFSSNFMMNLIRLFN